MLKDQLQEVEKGFRQPATEQEEKRRGNSDRSE